MSLENEALSLHLSGKSINTVLSMVLIRNASTSVRTTARKNESNRIETTHGKIKLDVNKSTKKSSELPNLFKREVI